MTLDFKGQHVRALGLSDLEGLLKKLPRGVGDRALANALSAGARVVRAEARRRAPVRQGAGAKKLSSGKGRLPGFGRASIGVGRVRGAGRGVTVAVHVGRAFYLMFLEFGTRHIAARPFLGPAADATEGAAFERIVAQLKKRIEVEAEKLARPINARARGRR